jgi:hypothetical protein
VLRPADQANLYAKEMRYIATLIYRGDAILRRGLLEARRLENDDVEAEAEAEDRTSVIGARQSRNSSGRLTGCLGMPERGEM